LPCELENTAFYLIEFASITAITEGFEMSEFKGVTVVKKANIFFNGGVTSRSILFEDGTKKTLGIAQLGEYEFNVGAAEIMEILAGELDVQLPGDSSWKPVKGGESFNVPANSTFSMKVKTLTDYCCSFAK
jgi:purine/pyrimidine-nucleoside phosphorylase